MVVLYRVQNKDFTSPEPLKATCPDVELRDKQIDFIKQNRIIREPYSLIGVSLGAR